MGRLGDEARALILKHGEGTAFWATAIMRTRLFSGLPEVSREAVQRAGQLHDIGKAYVPEMILLKPDRLDNAEWKEMRWHPVVGESIVRHLGSLGDEERGAVLGAILYHHERFDGRGYPRGLRGEEIPPAASVIAVADTFDALTAGRPYRDPAGAEEAVQIIRKESGAQFAPWAVEGLVAAIRDDPGLIRLDSLAGWATVAGLSK